MFRFSIRDVLWLTVVVALAVGWWLDHFYQIGLASELRYKLDEARHDIATLRFRDAMRPGPFD